MKKTLTLNIGGVVFHVEDEAYEILKHYLEKLKTYFNVQEDGKEILTDIESRIAELLFERISDAKQIIVSSMVRDVIAILGQPEDFSDEDADEVFEKNNASGSDNFRGATNLPGRKKQKRLYRDSYSKVIGGVCAGLSAYFNIDIIAIRVIFVLLFFLTSGSFGVIYLVLWIAVPEAVTVAQRLEMQGEPVNIDNIGKEFNDIKNNAKQQYDKFHTKFKENSSTRTPRPPKPPRPPRPPYSSRSGGGFGNFILSLFKIAGIFIGSLILVVLAVALFVLLAFVFGSNFPDTVAEIWNFNFGAFPSELAKTSATAASGLAICIGVPIFLLVYFISKLAFKHQGKTGWVLLLSFLLWFTGFIMVGSAMVDFIDKNGIPENWKNDWRSNVHINTESSKHNNRASSTYPLELNSDTLYINMSYNDTIEVLRDKNAHRINNTTYKKPDIAILPNNNDKVELEVLNLYKGTNETGKSLINWKLENDTLFLPYTYGVRGKNSKSYAVKLKVRIPEGKTVFIVSGNGTDNFTSVSFDEQKHNLREMDGKFWTMTNKGLK